MTPPFTADWAREAAGASGCIGTPAGVTDEDQPENSEGRSASFTAWIRNW
mgnify:CR=1 FL=1